MTVPSGECPSPPPPGSAVVVRRKEGGGSDIFRGCPSPRFDIEEEEVVAEDTEWEGGCRAPFSGPSRFASRDGLVSCGAFSRPLEDLCRVARPEWE